MFEQGARLVEQFGQDRLEAYLASEYFGENHDRGELNTKDDRILEVEKKEDLLALNGGWPRKYAKLVVLLTLEDMQGEVRRRGQALPDLDRRIAEGRPDKPPSMKLIRGLCDQAGHQLDWVKAGDLSRVREDVHTWGRLFVTDKGHHHTVDARGRVVMFPGHSATDRVCKMTRNRSHPGDIFLKN